MTLNEFLEFLGKNPDMVLGLFITVPVLAFLAGFFVKDEGNKSPWKYFYSALIYLVSIPGIFAIALNMYLFMFERISVFEADIFLQGLPILCMVATFLIIRRNVDLAQIPGFNRISGLLFMIFAALIIMWFIDKTRIFALTYIPVQYLLLFFLGLLLVFRLGWSKMTAQKS